MSKRLLLIGLAGLVASVLMIGRSPDNTLAQGGTGWSYPSRPGTGLQVGLISPAPTPAPISVETVIQHSCPQAPTTGEFSHAETATTNKGWTVVAGIIFLASDGNTATCTAGLGGGPTGWARLFAVVYDNNGNVVSNYLSRAGAGNPPPAASADSGGSADGWRTTINIDSSGTVSIYFDGILKTSYRGGKNAGASFSQGSLIAEREGVSAMDSQLASRHLREIRFSGVTSSANALYTSSSTCNDADIKVTTGDWLTGSNMHGLQAGFGTNPTDVCNYQNGAKLW